MGHTASPKVQQALRRRIDEYTVRPNAATDGIREPASVILVPPGADIDGGFVRAARLLDRGPVRVVGHGVTLAANWPDWVREASGLWLTELGAYRFRPALEATLDLRTALRSWTDHIFAGTLQKGTGAAVLYPAAAARFLQSTMESRAIAEGLAEAHRDDLVEVTDPRWPGWSQVEQLAGIRSPLGRAQQAARRLAWPALVGAACSAAWCATVVSQIRTFRESKASLLRLQTIRERQKEVEAPTLWVALIPDLIRVNAHVLESVAAPAVAAGVRLGVLLMGNLGAGTRSEADLRSRTGSAELLWPGLGNLADDAARVDVDQIVGPETTRDLLSVLGRAAISTAVVTGRLARSGGVIVEGRLRHDLLLHVGEVAKLATLDLARAISAERATEAAIRRRCFSDTQVVFVGCGAAAAAAANASLQEAGATTVDFVHGAGWDNSYGASESRASFRFVWTEPDARNFEPLGSKSVCIGMPRQVQSHPARSVPRNILILSNYCHRDTKKHGSWPLSVFQDELLELPRLLELREPGFQFRWRPHPSDAPEAVNRTLLRLPASVELSRGRTLQEDFDWSDAVVSSTSTAVYEALFAGVPVFAHVIPELYEASVYAFLDESRKFFKAHELPDKLLACLAALRRGDPSSTAPETRARAVLFGSLDGERVSPLAAIANLQSRGSDRLGLRHDGGLASRRLA